MIEFIVDYIKREGLDSKSREQYNVFRRHYLCAALYQTQELTQIQIGDIFKRDHSTIVNSIRKHEALKNDKVYQRMTQSCAELMNNAVILRKIKRNIFEDLDKVNNLQKLKRIKRWIKEGRYDENVCTFVGDRAANTVETDQKVGE
jgi:hypothetical protein